MTTPLIRIYEQPCALLDETQITFDAKFIVSNLIIGEQTGRSKEFLSNVVNKTSIRKIKMNFYFTDYCSQHLEQ